MAGNRNFDYKDIDQPYDGTMSRSEGGPTGHAGDGDEIGTVGKPALPEGMSYPGFPSREIKSGREFQNIWVKEWIKSRDYRPGANGWYLDGRSGDAFFSRISVNNRSNQPAVDIRKWEGDGVALNIQSYGDTALFVRQESDTPAAKFFTTSLSGASGATVEATNEANSGVVGSLKQDGTGNVLYLQRTNPETGQTEFYPQILFSGGAYTNLIKFWTSDGTDPDGDLSGSAGDVCYGTDGNMHMCQGGTSWSKVGLDGKELLADTQLGAAATSLDTGSFSAKAWLEIHIHFTDPLGGAVIPQLRFNSDSTSNYGYALNEITGTSSNAAATGINMWKTASTPGAHFTYTVCNRATERKIVTGTGMKQNGVNVFGGGYWKNVADQVTSVQLVTHPTNMNTGTRLTVYGSSF